MIRCDSCGAVADDYDNDTGWACMNCGGAGYYDDECMPFDYRMYEEEDVCEYEIRYIKPVHNQFDCSNSRSPELDRLILNLLGNDVYVFRKCAVRTTCQYVVFFKSGYAIIDEKGIYHNRFSTSLEHLFEQLKEIEPTICPEDLVIPECSKCDHYHLELSDDSSQKLAHSLQLLDNRGIDSNSFYRTIYDEIFLKIKVLGSEGLQNVYIDRIIMDKDGNICAGCSIEECPFNTVTYSIFGKDLAEIKQALDDMLEKEFKKIEADELY